MLLIERGPGVETRPLKTSYSATAGTAFVTFDNVKVPVENILGEEDKGLKVVLRYCPRHFHLRLRSWVCSNFNHERWMICCHAAAGHRTVVEECVKWANQRIVFGKPLHEQAVVRSKLAAMIARVEAGQAWLEAITYQMNKMVSALRGLYACLHVGSRTTRLRTN